LAQHFAQDPGTLPLLRRVAETDQPEGVRAAAVWSLGEHFAQDPEMLPLLRRVIESDQPEGVRGAAVSALAEHFAQDPETVALLRRAAEHDQNEDVRCTALLRLAENSSIPHAAMLFSRDLDGTMPGLDPREPIDNERVTMSADRLGLPSDKIRELYEQLAEEMPVLLGWLKPGRRVASTSRHRSART
jgi:HEAT repeats